MQTYGVARNTARKALLMLADQGYVRIVPGWGTFVTPRDQGIHDRGVENGAACSRIFLACMATMRSASSAPVSAATDGKYSRRRSSRNSSWPLMPS